MEKEKLPLISFVMPVYGDADTVERAVDSIVDQDYPNIEIILSVDGCKASEKAVRKIVKKYKDSERRVDALFSKKNRGACIARNEGAKLAEGEYLSFLPADAYLYPGAVRIWITHLLEYPDYDFLYGGYKFLDQKLTEEDIADMAKESGVSKKQFLEQFDIPKNSDGTFQGHKGFDYLSQPFDPYFLDTANYIDGSFPLKTEKFWEVGGWDPKIKSLQDWDLWLSVVKSGGKGLFMRDVFFSTEFPHRGGLSDDSSRNWLERTDQIKKKHGIKERTVCVTSLGAPFHARQTARLLDADFKEMPSFKPHRYESVYLLGFFPSIADQCGQVFQNCRGKRIVHWIGSDIWQMQQMDLFHRRVLLDFFEKNIDFHLCEAEFTQKELAELGVKAEIVPLPPRWFYDKNPLPDEFTVAVYQPQSNKDFYLPDLCKKVAKECPEIKFKFFGDNNEIGTVGNIEYVGYIENMQKFIDDCSAVLRLTIHDGLPLSVVEFLSAGRHALLNVPMKHAGFTRSPEPKVIAQELRKLKDLKLNDVGAKYWRNRCSHKRFKNKIYDLVKYKPERYWEGRAEYWSHVADQGYSLTESDAKTIVKWLKDIKFKDVLDIGCGNGRMVPWFEDKEYFGIDISKKLIKMAKDRYGSNTGRVFKQMKVEDIDMLDCKFDLIFSYTTLEHIVADQWPMAITALKASGKYGLFIEPTGFESMNYCHDHEYEKDFHVLKKKKLSDKMMYLVDLSK